MNDEQDKSIKIKVQSIKIKVVESSKCLLTKKRFKFMQCDFIIPKVDLTVLYVVQKNNDTIIQWYNSAIVR